MSASPKADDRRSIWSVCDRVGQFEFDTGERRHESKDRCRVGDSFGVVVRGRTGPG